MDMTETKRDRVRRLLINPLLQAGMRKQTRMKEADYSVMLDRLADKLGHLNDDHLRGLVPWITRHARGKDLNQWPDEVTIVSRGLMMQPPPPRDCPYVVSLLRSEAGRRARDAGYLTELLLSARKYGPPFSKLNLQTLASEGARNQAEVRRVQGMVDRGAAPLERRQWLDWYLRHQKEAVEIMDGQGAAA